MQAYNVSITVSISVEDTKTQKLILQDVALTDYFTSTYTVAIGDISQTKIAKEAAVQSACQDIASTVRSRVLDGFSKISKDLIAASFGVFNREVPGLFIQPQTA